MKLTALIAAGLLVGSVAVAAAEDNPAVPTKADRAAIAKCVKDTTEYGGTMEKCIGIIADPCLAEPGTDNDVLMTACLDREATIWDDRLNDHYRALMAGLDDERKGKLKAQQKQWISLRDQTCEMEASFWDGGTGASSAATRCFMRETASRAITLNGFLGYLDQ